jgi:hypothetical protein
VKKKERRKRGSNDTLENKRSVTLTIAQYTITTKSSFSVRVAWLSLFFVHCAVVDS